jgi:hypothetical protein
MDQVRDESRALQSELDELGRLPRSAETDARIALLQKRRGVLIQLALDRQAIQKLNTLLSRVQDKRMRLAKQRRNLKVLDEQIAELVNRRKEAQARFQQDCLLEFVLSKRATVLEPGSCKSMKCAVSTACTGRENMDARLAQTQDQLPAIQRNPSGRDRTAEAGLARQITLFDRKGVHFRF